MKSFQEFLSTEFTPEEKEKLRKKFVDSISTSCDEVSTDKSMSASVAVLSLGLQVSTGITLEMLNKYHDWLSGQL